MKYGKVIERNVRIEKGCEDDFSEVEKITGYLSVEGRKHPVTAVKLSRW